jgi:hypothetical protein
MILAATSQGPRYRRGRHSPVSEAAVKMASTERFDVFLPGNDDRDRIRAETAQAWNAIHSNKMLLT